MTAPLLDEAVNGFTNHLALSLAAVFGDGGELVALTLGEIDLCSHHFVAPMMYTPQLYINPRSSNSSDRRTAGIQHDPGHVIDRYRVAATDERRPSLTPGLLSEVLRYEPRHWKALQHRLSREHPGVWEGIGLSDEDFYARLHALLKDPVNRRAFEGAAQREGTRNRPLTLSGELHRHYWKSLRNDPSLAERMPKRAKPREVVDALASGDDDDRLANVVWSFVESGHLGFAELSRISGDYPGIRSRLAGAVKWIQTDSTPLMAKWAACLSQMRDALDAAEGQGPNSDVVELLAGHADELRELAAESVRFDSVWESLVELVEKHRDVFSDHHSLKPYARAVDDVRPCGESAQDAEELLEKIDGQLRLLARTAENLRKTPAAMAEANAEQRNKLIGEINKLRDDEAHICSDTERLLGELFGGFQLDVEAEASDTSTDTAGSHARTVGAEVNSTAVATENLDAPASEHVGDDAQVRSQQVDDGAASHRGGVGGNRIGCTPFETGEGLDSDGGSTEPGDTACEESDVSPESGSTAHAQEAGSQPTEPSDPPAVAIRHNENHETLSGRATPKDDEANSSEVATDALVHEKRGHRRRMKRS